MTESTTYEQSRQRIRNEIALQGGVDDHYTAAFVADLETIIEEADKAETIRQTIRYALGHLEDESGIGDPKGEAIDSLKGALGEGPYARRTG